MSPIDRLLRRAAPGLAALAFAGQVWGQSYGAPATSLLALRSSEELHPQFEVAYTTPALYKWYGPRHLPIGYLRPWYQDQLTNYAQQQFQRYLDADLEGDEWHDAFGRRLGRGWLVYTWEQEQPGRNSSRIRQGSFYNKVFGRLVISSDAAGGGMDASDAASSRSSSSLSARRAAYHLIGGTSGSASLRRRNTAPRTCS
jgi:hypothetical protein